MQHPCRQYLPGSVVGAGNSPARYRKIGAQAPDVLYYDRPFPVTNDLIRVS